MSMTLRTKAFLAIVGFYVASLVLGWTTNFEARVGFVHLAFWVSVLFGVYLCRAGWKVGRKDGVWSAFKTAAIMFALPLLLFPALVTGPGLALTAMLGNNATYNAKIVEKTCKQSRGLNCYPRVVVVLENGVRLSFSDRDLYDGPTHLRVKVRESAFGYWLLDANAKG